MVRISEIIVNEKDATCKYYPENKIEFGELRVNLVTEEIIDFTYPPHRCASMYLSHARKELIDISRSKEPIPAESYSVWY